MMDGGDSDNGDDDDDTELGLGSPATPPSARPSPASFAPQGALSNTAGSSLGSSTVGSYSADWGTNTGGSTLSQASHSSPERIPTPVATGRAATNDLAPPERVATPPPHTMAAATRVHHAQLRVNITSPTGVSRRSPAGLDADSPGSKSTSSFLKRVHNITTTQDAVTLLGLALTVASNLDDVHRDLIEANPTVKRQLQSAVELMAAAESLRCLVVHDDDTTGAPAGAATASTASSSSRSNITSTSTSTSITTTATASGRNAANPQVAQFIEAVTQCILVVQQAAAAIQQLRGAAAADPSKPGNSTTDNYVAESPASEGTASPGSPSDSPNSSGGPRRLARPGHKRRRVALIGRMPWDSPMSRTSVDDTGTHCSVLRAPYSLHRSSHTLHPSPCYRHGVACW